MDPTAATVTTRAASPAVESDPSPPHAITFTEVAQQFAPRTGPAFTALHEVNLTIGATEFCSIVGPSGCGKSTLLNMAAGLIQPTSGQVHVQGDRITSVNTRIGYVSQDSNLFPWLTARQNIELPLEIKGFSRADRRRLSSEWLELVGLTGFGESYPHQLSGGMQKRCSIARTLVYDPDVVLLDEPFGAVDAITRSVLQEVLLDLWSSRRKSVIFVTHDLNEAITLSDKVVVMTRRPGTIKAVVDIPLPRPRNVYEIAETAEFAEIHQELWGFFKTEIEMAGPPPTDEQAGENR
ncbi:MAG TPA: ABC transporter ATP-binding protein [Pseudonocardiaceae bacterium]|jgi:NitT/TauT family transport system ATP-binding protein|nr:ABC transporter ATP-binding protein [Pseudonocardiaceae bacterium]